MDDLISRRAAIEAIDNMLIEDEQYKVWMSLELKALPSVSEWIPVTERLPEDPLDVLVTYIKFRYWQVGLAFYDDVEQGWYTEKDGEYVEIEPHKNIIAWMPLPEPFKGGDA